jgi:hypothetical protein
MVFVKTSIGHVAGLLFALIPFHLLFLITWSAPIGFKPVDGSQTRIGDKLYSGAEGREGKRTKAEGNSTVMEQARTACNVILISPRGIPLFT